MTDMEHVDRVFGAIFGAFDTQPIYGEEFSVGGRDYCLIRWRSGWVWRDEKEVNESTVFGHGPWPTEAEARADAVRDAGERV